MNQKGLSLIDLMMLTGIIGLSIFALVIGIAGLCTSTNATSSEAWYQREIIGQGILAGVEIAGEDYLISLRLMDADSTPDNVMNSTYVFVVPRSRLTVRGAAEGYYDYTDVPVFELGTWHFLYRKLGIASIRNRYLLIIEDWPREGPLLVPRRGA